MHFSHIQSLVWELVDLGSLNGTHVNNESVPFDRSRGEAKRKHSIPIGLETGDILLLGSTSQILVSYSSVFLGLSVSFSHSKKKLA